MDFTSYNDFPKPDNGEAFGEEYRQWADDLDVLARKEGPIADRPASAPTGAIYDATDQQVRYRYDGSAWGVIGGIGSAAKPLPLVNTEELSVNDSQIWGRTSVSSDTTTDGTSIYWHVDTDAAAGTVTLTLASADAEEGLELNVKRDGQYDVTVDTESGETIEGDGSITLERDGEAVTLVYDVGTDDWGVW